MVQKLNRQVVKGKFEDVKIFNKGCITLGYKVPREFLKDFWSEYEFNPALKKRATPTDEGLSEELVTKEQP